MPGRCWPTPPAPRAAPHVEDTELFRALREEIEGALSEHQREVLVAVTLNDVPIDVLAELLQQTTRGALYKTLHDARRKLRTALAERGLGDRRNPRGGVMNDREKSGAPEREAVLARLLGPAGPELGCEECFAELDRYVELNLAGSDPDGHVPGMRAHLEGCPGLRGGLPEFQALLESELERVKRE